MEADTVRVAVVQASPKFFDTPATVEKVCALTAGNDFVQLEETEIEREVRRMERICKQAKIMFPSALWRGLLNKVWV